MPNNNLKLIVVADTGNLKIFEAQGLKITKTIEEIDLNKVFERHERQEKHQGYFHNQSNPAHFFDPHTSPKDIDRHNSAQKISELIDHLLTNNANYKELIVVADPKSLGHIRQCLNSKAKALITKEISKDLVHQSISDIEINIFA